MAEYEHIIPPFNEQHNFRIIPERNSVVLKHPFISNFREIRFCRETLNGFVWMFECLFLFIVYFVILNCRRIKCWHKVPLVAQCKLLFIFSKLVKTMEHIVFVVLFNGICGVCVVSPLLTQDFTSDLDFVFCTWSGRWSGFLEIIQNASG